MASKDNDVNYGTKEILGRLKIINGIDQPSITITTPSPTGVELLSLAHSEISLTTTSESSIINAGYIGTKCNSIQTYLAADEGGVLVEDLTTKKYTVFGNSYIGVSSDTGSNVKLISLPYKSGTFALNEDLKSYQGYTAADSRVVTDSTDLNTTNYCVTGIYRGNGSSYTNCPTANTFRLEVYSAEDASSIRDELTQNWVYRYRVLTDFYGNQWIQNVHSANTAGSFIYGAWKRVVANAGATSVWANNITLTAGTWAVQVHISGTVQNFFVFIDETNNADANRFKNLKFYNQHKGSTYLQITSATIGGNYILTYYNADNTAGTGRINYKRLD